MERHTFHRDDSYLFFLCTRDEKAATLGFNLFYFAVFRKNSHLL